MMGPHAGHLNGALDKTSQRQQLLMENMANVNVAGYKRRDTDFHIALQNELTEFDQTFPGSSRSSVVQATGSLRVDGNGVDMEKEVVSIAETELRYQTLTELTSRYFSGLRNVIREGR
jgi:flagellar basal-body rod protein FlgB